MTRKLTRLVTPENAPVVFTFALPLAIPLALMLLALCGCGAAGVHAPVTEPAPLVLRAADHTGGIVPGRYVVLYQPGAAPPTAELPGLDAAIVQSSEPDAQERLAALPGVAAVLRDRYVESTQMGIGIAAPAGGADEFYRTAQNWAVVQAGGYGAGVAGGPAAGPWSTTMGHGVRIAVLDSGVDATHPDIAPNLALAISEVDPAGLPSACDDGSPQDQHGHGTWAASLAAGAAGPGTGSVIGVAPQASLISIKVLERVAASDGADVAARCRAGSSAGLLSWVLKGLDDAVAAHADVVSLSLGSLVDLRTGDGAGWKAAFDRATHAAALAGVVVIAAAGNDGLDLSGTAANPSFFVELPAQARDVLAVVASTNPACAENSAPGAVCAPGAVTRASYSNYGSGLNAMAAPGGALPNASETGVSGYVRGACSSTACFSLGGAAYVQAMGTSASAPLTAGAAALLRAAHPAWSAGQVVAALRAAGARSGSGEPVLNTVGALTAQP